MGETGQPDNTTSDGDGDILTVRGVRKTYEADGAPVRALREAGLRIRRGEFVASRQRQPSAPAGV